MSRWLAAVEDGCHPRTARARLRSSAQVALDLLPAPDAAQGHLRRTRLVDAAAPADGALRLCVLALRELEGLGPTVRVVSVTEDAEVDLHTDGCVRSLRPGDPLRAEDRVVAVDGAGPPVVVQLRLVDDDPPPRHGPAPEPRWLTGARSRWRAPGARDGLRWAATWTGAAFAALTRRIDLSAATVALRALAALALGVAIVGWQGARRTADDATAQAAAARAEVQRLEQATARLVTELDRSRAERQRLAKRLSDATDARRYDVEAALGRAEALGRASHLGLRSEAWTPGALAADQAAAAALTAALVDHLTATREVPTGAACLAAVSDLNRGGLPGWLAALHPGEAPCAPWDDPVTGRLGPFALSTRALLAWSPDPVDPAVVGADGDPRHDPRAAAALLVRAVDAAGATLARAGTRRLPALPSQVDLWAAVLVDGWQRMPLAPGEGDPIATCVAEALEDLDQRREIPDAPTLLPPLHAAPPTLRLRPTRTCPWPADTVEAGVRAVRTAVARTALASSLTPR